MKKIPLFLLGIVWASQLALAASTPTVKADARHAPVLPESSDLFTLEYEASNPEAIDDLARLVRSFTAPTSQIIPNSKDRVLQITDSAAALKKVYPLIRDNDVKPTPEMKKKWQELEKAADQRKSGAK